MVTMGSNDLLHSTNDVLVLKSSEKIPYLSLIKWKHDVVVSKTTNLAEYNQYMNNQVSCSGLGGASNFKYSQTFLMWPSKRTVKCGHITQVVVKKGLIDIKCTVMGNKN